MVMTNPPQKQDTLQPQAIMKYRKPRRLGLFPRAAKQQGVEARGTAGSMVEIDKTTQNLGSVLGNPREQMQFLWDD